MKLSKLKLSVLFGTLAVLAVFVCVKMVAADADSTGYGYFWSSNIGWMRLNDCTNPATSSTCTPAASYGVNVLPMNPGTITGYMWSSNIGWITFNVAGCPTSGCTPGAYVTWNSDGTGAVHGWARACSVYANGCSGSLKSDTVLGSWDGYIALDSGSGGGTGGTWGLTIGTDKKIGGFAWGSEVIGWVKSVTGALNFNGPNAQLAANPSSIKKGASSTLTVTAYNIDGTNSCQITPEGSTTPISGLAMSQSGVTWTGHVTVSPARTILYTVNCTKGSQTATATATVKVTYIITPPGCDTNPQDCCPPDGTKNCGGDTGCTTNPGNCCPPNGTKDCGGGSGGSGGNGGSGGYCAINYPQLAWDSDADYCTISSGGNSLRVAPNSKDQGGSLSSDGLYYATVPIAVSGTGSTYTFQCTGGTITTPQQIVVPACQKDFYITATPNSQQFVASGKDKMIATFMVAGVPQYGFVGTVNLGVQSWPSNMPHSRDYTYSPASITCTASGCTTSQLIISVDTADLKKSDAYKNIILRGVSGTLNRTTSVEIDSTVKIKPIFNEF